MRRAMLLGVILAIALSAVAVAKGPAPSVTGTYTYTIPCDGCFISREILVKHDRWSWTRLDVDGNAIDGVNGDVACLVADGRDAWLAGPATAGTTPGLELGVTGAFLWVHDGDRPRGAGDLAITWMSDPGWTWHDMVTLCQNKATVFTPEAMAAIGVPYNDLMDGLVRQPLTSGDLKVVAGK